MSRKSGGEIEPKNFLPPCCTFNAILASAEKQDPEEESVFYCQHKEYCQDFHVLENHKCLYVE